MSARKKGSIGLFTAKKQAQLTKSDALILKAFEAKGFSGHALVWDAPLKSTLFCDHYLVRSIWGYHRKCDFYLLWLDHLEDHKLDVQNSTALLKWNFDKSYLLELNQKGINIVPTRLLVGEDEWTLEEVMQQEGFDRAVIKPTRGASAYGLKMVSRQKIEEGERHCDQLLCDSDILLQPFMTSILQEGEISLIYIGGEYSHGVIKKPKEGEVRVQEEYGGSTLRFDPEPPLISFGKKVLEACPQMPFMARVDFVMMDGKPYLMELELIEPELFYELYPEKTQMLVDMWLNLS